MKKDKKFSDWTNVKPEKVKDPKAFIMNVLQWEAGWENSEPGIKIGKYIAGIKKEKTREKFVAALKELCFTDSGPDTADWVKEELHLAYATWRWKDEKGREKEEKNEW